MDSRADDVLVQLPGRAAPNAVLLRRCVDCGPRALRQVHPCVCRARVPPRQRDHADQAAVRHSAQSATLSVARVWPVRGGAIDGHQRAEEAAQESQLPRRVLPRPDQPAHRHGQGSRRAVLRAGAAARRVPD